MKKLKETNGIETIVCVTAQHREMLDQVLKVFDINPDYDLDIMKHGQTLGDITTRALIKLEKVIKDEMPDIVLVHGDTATTFVGSIAAYYNKVAIGHVEAGLRTYDKYAPWPEEVNRQMVDCVADLFFAPTELSKDNLLKENKPEEKIYVTGNTAIDALKTTISDEYNHEMFEWVGNDKLIMLTAHRRENIGKPMENIFRAIRRIVEENKDVKVIYPIHMNPQVKEIADKELVGCDRIKIIPPLEVIDFHNFLNKSYLILTDSGGIQEEAPSLGKPVLVLRETTERPEGIAAGTLKLAGVKEEEIYNHIKELLENKEEYEKMSKASNPYGDGTASKQIVGAIISEFKNKMDV